LSVAHKDISQLLWEVPLTQPQCRSTPESHELMGPIDTEVKPQGGTAGASTAVPPSLAATGAATQSRWTALSRSFPAGSLVPLMGYRTPVAPSPAT